MTSGPGDRELSERARVVPLAPPPRPVPPPSWSFPDPARADEDGVVGVGADLAASTLVYAYRRGIFPWPHVRMPLPWFSPDPRGILPLDGVHVSRSLRRRVRECGWTTTVDTAFSAVIANCADRPSADGTWITPKMQRAYTHLHGLGWTHSVEVWDGHALVGGLYGVQVGGCFTGESMFHRESDASKVALLDLADRLREAGADLLDVQIVTPHLAALGAVEVPRGSFLDQLAAARDREVRLAVDPRPAARLAPR